MSRRFVCSFHRSFIVTASLILTTLILSCALILTMADEFQMSPKPLENISSNLAQDRAFRTLFICGIVTLMCFASTLSLVIIFALFPTVLVLSYWWFLSISRGIRCDEIRNKLKSRKVLHTLSVPS